MGSKITKTMEQMGGLYKVIGKALSREQGPHPKNIFPFHIGPANKDGNRRDHIVSIKDPDTGKFVVVPLHWQIGSSVDKANGSQALEFAKGIGLHRFPTFDTREEARDKIEEIQANLNEDSTLIKVKTPVEDKQAISEAVTGQRSRPLSTSGINPMDLEGLRAGDLSEDNREAFDDLRQEQRNLDYMEDPRSGFVESVNGMAPFMRNKVYGDERSGEEHVKDTHTNIMGLKKRLGVEGQGSNKLPYLDQSSEPEAPSPDKAGTSLGVRFGGVE